MSAFSDQLSILIHRVLETGFGDLLTDLASGACFELSENREEDLSLNNAPLKKIIDQAKKRKKSEGSPRYVSLKERSNGRINRD